MMRAINPIASAAAQVEALNASARYIAQSTDEAMQALQLGIEREAGAAELRRLLAAYQWRRAAQNDLETRGREALDLLLLRLRHPDPPLASGCPAYRPAPIGLHGDETAHELSRLADAAERIAAHLEGAAALHQERQSTP